MLDAASVPEKIKIAQPHDKLAKKLLSNLDAVRDVLQLFLPDSLLNMLDLDKLELQKETYFNFLFKENRVDLLFKIPTKNNEGYVYVLLEHQSSADKWMPLRVLQYLGPVWEDLKKNSNIDGTIPYIYPLVLYNGKYCYSKSITMYDLIYPKVPREHFDKFFLPSFHLVDLTQVNEKYLIEAMHEHALGVALLLTLKHIFDPDLEIAFETILLDVYKKLDKNGHRNELMDMICYLLSEGDFSDKKKFYSILQNEFSKELGDKTMTIIEQERQEAKVEGKIEGKIEGKTEAKVEVVKNLLKENFDFKFISKVTELPESSIREIKHQMHNFC